MEPLGLGDGRGWAGSGGGGGGRHGLAWERLVTNLGQSGCGFLMAKQLVGR